MSRRLGAACIALVHMFANSLWLVRAGSGPLAVASYRVMPKLHACAGLIAYFMVGYVIHLESVLVYLAAYALFQITSESIGTLCAALTSTSTNAILALTFVLLILLSFSGFLVSDVPVYFKCEPGACTRGFQSMHPRCSC